MINISWYWFNLLVDIYIINMTKNIHWVYFAHKMPWNRTLSHILKKETQPVTIKTKRIRAKVQYNCDKCKGKLVNSHTKKRHDNEISSQISVMNTSQKVYEDINTDELSHLVLSGQNEISMQNVKWSVDIEEV